MRCLIHPSNRIRCVVIMFMDCVLRQRRQWGIYGYGREQTAEALWISGRNYHNDDDDNVEDVSTIQLRGGFFFFFGWFDDVYSCCFGLV